MVPSRIMSQRAGGDAAGASEPDWQLLASGRLAQIHAEAALYQAGDTTRCFIHVRISNTTSAPLGVDLTDDWNIVYPNQWTVSPEPRRLLVDETEIPPRPLTSTERRRLREQYRSNGLVRIRTKARKTTSGISTRNAQRALA